MCKATPHLLYELEDLLFSKHLLVYSDCHKFERGGRKEGRGHDFVQLPNYFVNENHSLSAKNALMKKIHVIFN